MKRFLLLAGGAILVITALMVWSDPTLSGRLGELWAAGTTPSGAPHLRVVRDYFPGMTDIVLHDVVLGAALLGLGYVTERVMHSSSRISAIGIACIVTTWASALTLIAYHELFFPGIEPGDDAGARLARSLRIEFVKYWMLVCVVSSAICWLGAATAIRWRNRSITAP